MQKKGKKWQNFGLFDPLAKSHVMDKNFHIAYAGAIMDTYLHAKFQVCGIKTLDEESAETTFFLAIFEKRVVFWAIFGPIFGRGRAII